MVRQVGPPVFDEENMMRRGVIVRHMMLPGGLIDSKRIVRYLWETYGDEIFMSLMSQYTPVAGAADYPEINRKVPWPDYFDLVDYAADLGVTQAFVQEEEAASESFIPDFEHFDLEKYLS